MQQAREVSAQEQDRLNTIAAKNAKLVKVSIHMPIHICSLMSCLHVYSMCVYAILTTQLTLRTHRIYVYMYMQSNVGQATRGPAYGISDIDRMLDGQEDGEYSADDDSNGQNYDGREDSGDDDKMYTSASSSAYAGEAGKSGRSRGHRGVAGYSKSTR